MSYQALLFCPDEKTARVVTQVLNELEFHVEPCSEPFAAVKKLTAQHFDAIVVDCENEQNAALLFKSARNSGSNQASLSVAVVEGQAGVAKAFRIGANLVLTKPINVEQSKGTLRVARGLLRKAETTKAGATGAESTRQILPPVPPTQKSPLTFSPSQRTPTPFAAASSSFELDEEPAPAPGPAEAALMDYMPESMPAASGHPAQPAPGSGRLKEYPWQPISKPGSEPMASALRRAAEAVGKPATEPSSKAIVPQAKLAEAATSKEPGFASLSSRLGAATAPAPAKETPRTAVPQKSDDEPEFTRAWEDAPDSQAAAAPVFSSLGDMQDEEISSAGGGKKKLLLAAAALLLAAAGYFGWSKVQRTSGPPAVQEQPAPVQAPAPEAPPQPASTSATQSETNPVPVIEVPAQQPEEISVTPAPKAAPAKPSAAIPVPAPAVKTAPASKSQEVVVVKNNVSSHAGTGPASEPAQPPAISLGANADDNAISGIVSTTVVSVPKPVPQTLRVSQGITQGLVLKRVQPAYPEQARQLRIQGAVQLQANISKDGSITNVKLFSGDAILGRAAMDAVRQWKYKPYYLNGEPVEIQTQITVNFKLP